MFCALLAPGADASGLQVAPILLEFADGETTQVLHVANSGEQPLRAQVRVFAWTQADGGERLRPDRDLAASPPLMELAPGQEQLVRIIRLRPQTPQREQAYRLFVDELPSPAGAGRPSVQLLLRHSLPVFVLPPGAKPASERRGRTDASMLAAEARAAGDGVVLSVRNAGERRVRLSQVVFEGTDGQQATLVPGLLGYVLAGQRMQWALQLAPKQLARGGTFKARLNDDAEPQALPAASLAR
jgi:fimbrial chaperone protein